MGLGKMPLVLSNIFPKLGSTCAVHQRKRAGSYWGYHINELCGLQILEGRSPDNLSPHRWESSLCKDLFHLGHALPLLHRLQGQRGIQERGVLLLLLLSPKALLGGCSLQDAATK